MYVVPCRKCKEDMKIPAWEYAEMLVNGGWIAHSVCPCDLPQPGGPTMNLLHPERLGLFEGIRSLFRKRNAPS